MKTPARRSRIAFGLDEEAMRRLARTVRPGSNARLELVFADGQRASIARGVDQADVRALAEAVKRNEDACIELVFAGRERRSRRAV